MRKIMCGLCAIVLVAGCGSKETASTTTTTTPVVQETQPIQTDLVRIGSQYLAKGDAVNALGAFREAIKINPKDVKAHFILGQIYMQMAQYDDAVENFQSVTQIEPDNGQAYLLLGGCYDLQGKKTDAIAAVKKSIEIFQQQRDETNFKRSLAVFQKLTAVETNNPIP